MRFRIRFNSLGGQPSVIAFNKPSPSSPEGIRVELSTSQVNLRVGSSSNPQSIGLQPNVFYFVLLEAFDTELRLSISDAGFGDASAQVFFTLPVGGGLLDAQVGDVLTVLLQNNLELYELALSQDPE